MTEWEKAQAGYLYDANNDQNLLKARKVCADLCFEYNNCRPSDGERLRELLDGILGEIRGEVEIIPPFYADYGKNISVGEGFFANHNLDVLDAAKVTIGDHVFIAPNCVISTAGHPLDPEQRCAGLEIALPITIGDHVWIGANVSILPGVTIGKNSIIGAGSVVNKDIPEGVIAAGVPCKVIRKVTEEDKYRYPTV